ncbi:Uncharacterised protein [Mycobacterium tuberculosis]|uniref:Uncharacterized protein n=1 Tax=Mycobacterium tuberculosis TaxID=1773 RepID=A0A916PDK5_MYCTX|nr:Uncharacterised protein [Mycobacterium tuberculosis]
MPASCLVQASSVPVDGPPANDHTCVVPSSRWIAVVCPEQPTVRSTTR